jgi:hypothetical protein
MPHTPQGEVIQRPNGNSEVDRRNQRRLRFAEIEVTPITTNWMKCKAVASTSINASIARVP